MRGGTKGLAPQADTCDYHAEGCRHAGKSATAITQAEAKKRGLEPCKVCKPDE